MIAFVEINLNEGISKKILNQANALSKLYGECNLYCIDLKKNFQIIRLEKDNLEYKIVKCKKIKKLNKILVLREFIKFICSNFDSRSKLIYIRHMIPTFYLIYFLYKNKNNKIYYEIPTYPYFYEQITSSNNKLKTILRLVYETFFWIFIYTMVNKIIAINSNSNSHKFKKMLYINNGIGTFFKNNVQQKYDLQKKELILIGVGTIHRYHGYNKIIDAMKDYNGDLNILFYIIGNGMTESLKKKVEEYNLENKVIFTGLLNSKKLEKFYSIAHVGIGTMSLELRHANKDTAIKVIEYYSYGLPVLSSGICPTVDDIDFLPYFKCDGEIDFNSIYKWNKSISYEERSLLAYNARNQFQWTEIFKKIL